jgi:hypothetical protein
MDINMDINHVDAVADGLYIGLKPPVGAIHPLITNKKTLSYVAYGINCNNGGALSYLKVNPDDTNDNETYKMLYLVSTHDIIFKKYIEVHVAQCKQLADTLNSNLESKLREYTRWFETNLGHRPINELGFEDVKELFGNKIGELKIGELKIVELKHIICGIYKCKVGISLLSGNYHDTYQLFYGGGVDYTTYTTDTYDEWVGDSVKNPLKYNNVVDYINILLGRAHVINSNMQGNTLDPKKLFFIVDQIAQGKHKGISIPLRIKHYKTHCKSITSSN